MNSILIAILTLLPSFSDASSGQNLAGTLSEEAQLSILTVGPADQPYTMFGHTALRLQDPENAIDRVYNYGTFDFNTRYFYLRFIYGNLNYFLSVNSFEAFKESNVQLGRSIKSQVLNLSQAELNSVVQKIEQNLMQENRYYRYEFFSNNCVTKVRDVAISPDIVTVYEPQDKQLPTLTYRQLTNLYLAERPWIRLGINIMLGARADYIAGTWNRNFLPEPLYQSLAGYYDSISGEPLVSSSEIINKPDNVDSEHLQIQPVVVFWLFFFIVGSLTLGSIFYGWNLANLDRTLFGITGILGVIIIFTMLFSLHEPLQNNWNILWALPTHLIIAAGTHKFASRMWFRYYLWMAFMLHLLLFGGWFFIPQQLPIAVIPFTGALIIRLSRLLTKEPAKDLNQKQIT